MPNEIKPAPKKGEKELVKPEKPLTSEQKKIMFNLFVSKINNESSKILQKRQEVTAELAKKIKEKYSKIPEVKKALADLAKAKELSKRAIDVLAKKKISTTTQYKNGQELVDFFFDTYNNEEMKEDRIKHEEKMKAIQELKLKIQADIYCLPMSAAEMQTYVEKQISQIIK